MTKIQPRILELLEGGKLEGLPAEVFVRGFIRSYAKCCGLDQAEALTRYSAASQVQAMATAPAQPSTLATPLAARPMVDAPAKPAIEAPAIDFAEGSLVEIKPPPIASPGFAGARSNADALRRSIEVEVAVEASAEPARTAQSSRKKKRRGAKRAKRSSALSPLATGTPPTPTPVVEAALEAVVEAVVEVEAATAIEAAVVEPAADVVAPIDHLDPLVEPTYHEDVIATETWKPKMPPATTTASVPWRRSAYVTTSTASASVPTLVIDDADPEHAAQVLEDRQAATSVLTNAQRRSFLPPILLDREDRSARQGGLTLAVIILLIAATLTLSYLMRRPSSSGDGVTMKETETQPERVVG